MKNYSNIQMYLSPEQCEIFEIPYYTSGAKEINKSMLLKSLDSKDLYHFKLFENFKKNTFKIHRINGKDQPGWYNLQTIDIEIF